jgi:hypothetical protein
MPQKPASLRLGREVLAFALAGILALLIFLFAGKGTGDGPSPEGATPKGGDEPPASAPVQP